MNALIRGRVTVLGTDRAKLRMYQTRGPKTPPQEGRSHHALDHRPDQP